MKLGKFQCAKCQSSRDLTVHHDAERFSSILEKAVADLGDPGDSFEMKTSVAEWVAQYHEKNNVSGIVLCLDCHRREHFGIQPITEVS